MLPFPPFSEASWIASSSVGSPQCGVPAPYLRKAFSLSRAVKSATLRVTALGLYECEINGRRAGDDALAPGWTNYHKRVYYQEHEVGALLRPGANAIGALLGDGWYCGQISCRSRQLYGDRPQFIATLSIIYDDDSREVVATDAAWKTAASPVLQNDLIAGETYDARLESEGWSSPEFDDSSWDPVEIVSNAGLALEVSPSPPIRRVEEIIPISKIVKKVWPSPMVIVDLGQNFTGRIRLKVVGHRGQTLTLRHAEILESDGTLYLDNLRRARATDNYTCKGGIEEIWEPRFTFHGFRYVGISGLEKDQPIDIAGIVLHSDMSQSGFFACSNPLLNKLQNNILWSQKSNFLDVPTDCPQRDERLGWTGDAQVFIRTACFNLDVQGFFHKWASDVRDSQRPGGAVPCHAPESDFLPRRKETLPEADGGPGWSDAIIICPWTIYLCYADTKILAENYEAMRRFMSFLENHSSKDYIRAHPDIAGEGWGDHLAMDSGTPNDLIGTAFYAYDAEIMARIATVLGHAEDALRYARLHHNIVQAFRRRFVTPEGLVARGTQTAYVLALHFGLISEDARATAVRELVRDIKRRNFHLSTGFIGTPYLLHVLSENGQIDVAYRLLEQETFPSWLFPVRQGATTIWERWDGWTPEKGFQDKIMNSFNHYAYGAVGDWMYQVVAGLEIDRAEPGYRHIIFRPRPGGTITWAEARLQVPQGEISLRWDLQNGEFLAEVKVPAGSRATFYPPYGTSGPVALEAGTHRLSYSGSSLNHETDV